MITCHIQGWAKSHPAKTALIYDDTPISYASFARAIEAARSFLQQQQIPPGRNAIVLVNNLRDAWVLVLALRALGLTTIAVQSIAEAEQLKLRDVDYTVLLQRELPEHKLKDKSLVGTKVVVVPDSSYADVDVGALPSPQEDAPAFGGHILYTSGSTGTYKKVLLGGHDDEERNAWWIRSFSLNESTVFHTLKFGLWTAVGFGFPPAVWQAGGCVVIDQREDYLKNIVHHGITNILLLPSKIREALRAIGTEAHQDFELIVSGGFLPLALAEEARRHLTAKLTILYASTECPAVLRSQFEHSEDVHWLAPFSERTIQVVDHDGNECAPGSEGDLRILLNDTDASAYLDDPTASAKFFRDGYFYPGDLAVKRADGRIRILGRSADVLNVQGLKIAVAPLEEAIQHHLQVEAVCLFSGLNDNGKEELVIAIQSAHEVPRHQLEAIAKLEAVARVVAAFGSYRCSTFKDFPRTKTGMSKIQRAVLRKLVFAQ